MWPGKIILVLLFASLFFSYSPVALRAVEQAWYLISEEELQSLERYRETSEKEKQTLLLQASELKTLAANSLREQESLNQQLAAARELQRRSEQSFNVYEAENLMMISSKNGEIADLKQTVADKTLETESYKKKMARLLAISIILFLTAAITAFIVLRRKLWK